MSTVLASPAIAQAPSTSQLTPLMGANFAVLSANYAFIALVGTLAYQLGLAAWHLGLVITTVGVLWVLCSPRWGRLAGRIGHASALRRALTGVALSMLALAAYLQWALGQPAAPLAALSFAVLLVTRVVTGACIAGVPVVSVGWMASRTAPSARAAVMARFGAAGAVGMVISPPIAGWLGSNLGAPATLFVASLLPLLPLLLLGRLEASAPVTGSTPPPSAKLKWHDARIRLPWFSSFALYSVVIVANVCIGFYLIDRVGTTPAGAAAAAGTALGAAGLALMLSQSLVARLPKTAPITWLRVGALLAGVGFGSVLLALQPWMVAVSFFVAGFGMGLCFPALSALAANSVEGPEQGACAAAMSMAQGMSMVIAPVLGALLYDMTPIAPFVLMATLAAAVLFAAVFRRA